MSLLKKAPLRAYLLARLKTRGKGRFKRIGGETYVAIADFVERAIGQFGHGADHRYSGPVPGERILTASKVCQLHLYNVRRAHPELEITSVKAEFVERIAARLVKWLDGAIHEHPSIGSTFILR